MSDINFLIDEKKSLSKNILLSENDVKFYKVDEITKQTSDEYLLRFNVPIEHNPAQFIQASILGIGEAPISICSYNDKYFEISVRAVGNVSSHICGLKKGEVLGIRGPYGNGYNMQHFYDNNIIIIGGGCGTAPVRGVIEYIKNNRGKFYNVDIFFGFRTKEDILFQKDFKEWTDKSMNLNIALSEDENTQPYQKGFVTDLLNDSTSIKSNENKIVIVCGPPIMIKMTCQKLLENGFNKDQIFFSEERHMKCGVGRCGHCMINDKYCCTDGPVFRYDEMEEYTD
ncbi:MAG: FAD/NAD(P)-binding protein [Nanoarchaeota archaeon]